jgi:hypothetical protein
MSFTVSCRLPTTVVRPLRPSLLLLVTLVVAGCASSSTYLPLTVIVRDRESLAPVASAVVDARPVSFFVPAYPFGIIDPSPPRATRTETGADGTARFEMIVDHPVHLTVVAAGYPPAVVYVDRHPARHGESDWLDPAESESAAADEAPGVQVRLVP